MKVVHRILGSVAPFALVLACETAPDQIVSGIRAHAFADAEWSEPVNLGSLINTEFNDANAALSHDELRLYFVSNRPGGFGGTDIWVAERQCIGCPWQAPVNLGASINTAAAEGSPSLSADNRLLFFFSARPGGAGAQDLYVSHRATGNPAAEEWGAAVNLGPDVNTAAAEQGSYYVREGGVGTAFVYFNRPVGGGDIYKVPVSSDGVPLEAAAPVAELNDPVGAEQKVSVSTNGFELLISTTRAGGLGTFDIWRSTRAHPQDPWSTPAHVEGAVNTSDIDSQPHLSRNGQTLIFTSNRPGGSGGTDLWMATRAPSGH